MKKLGWMVILSLLWVVSCHSIAQSFKPDSSQSVPPAAVRYAQATNAKNFADSYKAILPSKSSEGETYRWAIPSGGTLTYSFVTAKNAPGYPDSEPDKVSPIPKVTEGYVKDILEEMYSAVIPVKFKQVPDTNDPDKTADIRVMIYENNSGSYASAHYPNLYGDSRDGDVYLYSGGGDWTKGPGSAEYASIIHELGHAMGLKHPGRYATSDEEPYLPLAKDNTINTVMSYNVDKNLGEEPSSWNWSLMAYDIAALQHLYGANRSFQAGDTVYQLNSDGTTLYPYSSAERQFWATQSIWDGGGQDTIDASALEPNPQGYHFDLRPGGQITTQEALNSGSYTLFAPANQNPNGSEDEAFPFSQFATVIGLEVQIEDLIGSSSNDEVMGNKAANRLRGGAGDDRLDGGPGNDLLDGGDGDDVLVASEGADQLQGGRGNDLYQIDVLQAAGTQIQDTDGFDRLVLKDGSSNLDLAAGQVGLFQQGHDLLIDLNRDGIAQATTDLTITNFFTTTDTLAAGAIEAIGDWSSAEIMAHLHHPQA